MPASIGSLSQLPATDLATFRRDGSATDLNVFRLVTERSGSLDLHAQVTSGTTHSLHLNVWDVGGREVANTSNRSLSVNVVSGQPYYVLVNASGAAASYSLDLSLTPHGSGISAFERNGLAALVPVGHHSTPIAVNVPVGGNTPAVSQTSTNTVTGTLLPGRTVSTAHHPNPVKSLQGSSAPRPSTGTSPEGTVIPLAVESPPVINTTAHPGLFSAMTVPDLILGTSYPRMTVAPVVVPAETNTTAPPGPSAMTVPPNPIPGSTFPASVEAIGPVVLPTVTNTATPPNLPTIAAKTGNSNVRDASQGSPEGVVPGVVPTVTNTTTPPSSLPTIAVKTPHSNTRDASQDSSERNVTSRAPKQTRTPTAPTMPPANAVNTLPPPSEASSSPVGSSLPSAPVLNALLASPKPTKTSPPTEAMTFHSSNRLTLGVTFSPDSRAAHTGGKSRCSSLDHRTSLQEDGQGSNISTSPRKPPWNPTGSRTVAVVSGPTERSSAAATTKPEIAGATRDFPAVSQPEAETVSADIDQPAEVSSQGMRLLASLTEHLSTVLKKLDSPPENPGTANSKALDALFAGTSVGTAFSTSIASLSRVPGWVWASLILGLSSDCSLPDGSKRKRRRWLPARISRTGEAEPETLDTCPTLNAT